LGSICSRPQYGWTTKAVAGHGEVRLLRTTDISKGWIDWDTVPYCTEVPENLAGYRLDAGDIVISRAGSVGVSYLLQQVPVQSVFASYLIRFRPHDSVDPKYVSYYLHTPAYWARIHEESAGIALANVNARKLETIEIPLAPLAEQRRIVEAIEQQFTRLDAGVAALKRARVALKRYRAAVLKAAVEGRLTTAWRAEHPNIEPASDLLQRILTERRVKWEADMRAKGKDPVKTRYVAPEVPDMENLPELPKGWCWVTLGQIATFQNGRAFPSKEYTSNGVKLLRPGNLFADGSVRWTVANTRYMPIAWADMSSDLLIGEGELVMNLTAQSLKDEFLGRVCMTGPGEYCLLNQRLARITPVSGFGPRYALYLLKSSIFRRFVDGLNTGSLIQHMFTSQLNDFSCPLPPIEEQEQIVAEVESRLSIVSELEATIEANLKRADWLRQSILERAFAGKLVPQCPGDEPASLLLERIREQREGPKSNGRIINGLTGHNAMPVTTQATLWGKE
jgi:type I restriction enzyme S subunit